MSRDQMTTARRPVARAEHDVRMHGRISVLLSDVAAEGEQFHLLCDCAIRREVRGLWAKPSEAERYRARVIGWSPVRKRGRTPADHETGVPPIVPVGLEPSAMLRHRVQARRCRRRDRTC